MKTKKDTTPSRAKRMLKKVRAQASKRSSAKVLTTEEYKILWDKYNVKKRS